MPRWLDSIFLWQLDTEIQPNMFNWTPHPWTLKVNIVDSHWKLAWFCYTKIRTWMLRINKNKCLQILGDFINVVLFILEVLEFPPSSIWLQWIWRKKKKLKIYGRLWIHTQEHIFWKVKHKQPDTSIMVQLGVTTNFLKIFTIIINTSGNYLQLPLYTLSFVLLIYMRQFWVISSRQTTVIKKKYSYITNWNDWHRDRDFQ